MKYLLLILIIGGCYTSSHEKRIERAEDWTKHKNEWVDSAQGKEDIKLLLEEGFDALLWDEINGLLPEGIMGTIMLLLGGGLWNERIKKHAENIRAGNRNSLPQGGEASV